MSVALITGASQGFGRALAIDLAERGWNLVIDGRHEEPLEEVKELLGPTGVEVWPVVGDVADPDHRSMLVASAEKFGGLDLLVNNASELGPSPLPTLDVFPLSEFRRIFEVNVIAPLALIQEALPLLQGSQGTIVSLSSDAAVVPYEGWGGYGSSKAALDQLHLVLGTEQPKMRVYAFDPGDMRTDMHKRATPDEDISELPDPESVVPSLHRLLDARPPSGRYRAIDWARS